MIKIAEKIAQWEPMPYARDIGEINYFECICSNLYRQYKDAIDVSLAATVVSDTSTDEGLFLWDYCAFVKVFNNYYHPEMQYPSGQIKPALATLLKDGVMYNINRIDEYIEKVTTAAKRLLLYQSSNT